MEEIADKLVYFVVFVLSVTLHEAAHAWAAQRGGDPTAYLGGQVSLNPIPHMRREPFGMLLLPVLTVLTTGWPFGYASAPYDVRWAARYPRRAAWMSLAGPGANLGLMLITAVIIRVGLALGSLSWPESIYFSSVTVASDASAGSLWVGVAFTLSVLFSMNLVLLLLNMIPVPPLDGSGALPLLLPESMVESYRSFVHQPMIGIVGILIAWKIFGMVFHPIFFFVVNLLYPEVQYG